MNEALKAKWLPRFFLGREISSEENPKYVCRVREPRWAAEVHWVGAC